MHVEISLETACCSVSSPPWVSAFQLRKPAASAAEFVHNLLHCHHSNHRPVNKQALSEQSTVLLSFKCKPITMGPFVKSFMMVKVVMDEAITAQSLKT